MGSAGSKSTHFDEAQKLFNQREKELLLNVFEKLSVEDSERPGRKVIKFEQFKNHVSWLLPEETAKRFFKEMSRSSWEFSRDAGAACEQQVTKEGWFILMFKVLKKSNEEKSRIFYSMIADADCIITSADIEQLLILLLNCYATALKKTEVGSMWKLNTIQKSNERFANMAVKELLRNKPHPSYVDVEEVYVWISKEPLVGQLFENVLTACIMDPSCIIEGAHHGISEGCDETIKHVEFNKSNILVPCKLCVDFSEVKTLLDIPSILAINHHLPAVCRHQWRLLFSSKTHGESFQAFIHQIVNQGPTVLLVKDTDRHIFGGFASESWLVRSQFQGTNKCFLFALSPTMAFYQPTEFNTNYMYLNMGMRTMPNGLGMGGQLMYFGLWLDENFGLGHSKAGPQCTTYGSPRLSKNEEFTIDTVEVWGVGTPPETILKEKSVLDTEIEAKAFLEITGKKMNSEGYREFKD